MSSDFAVLAHKLDKVTTALGPVGLKAALEIVGVAAKADLVVEAGRVVGADLKYSGWPRVGKLGSRFDIAGTTITVKPRPYGAWMVAEHGRRATAAPKRATPGSSRAMFGEGRRDRVNMLTPVGWRAYTKANPLQIGPTPARHALTVGAAIIQRESAPRFHREMDRLLGEVFDRG